MKKLWILLISMFVLTACAPAVSSAMAMFVPLPDAEKLGITGVVVALLGLLFSWAGTKIPWTKPFITRFKEEITVTISALVVGLVENALPGAYPEIGLLVVQLVLAALATIGLFKFLGKVGFRGFK